jgi:hypothetical protein
MNVIKLFENEDMKNEITTYLNFDEIVNLSKSINKNCFKKYNFFSDDFKLKNISEIFNFLKNEDELPDEEMEDDVYIEYLNDLIFNFTSEIQEYYYDLYDLYDDFDYDSDNPYKDSNNACLEMSIQRDIEHFFYQTYMEIYCRKVAEMIEYNNLSMKLFNSPLNEVDEAMEKINYDIHNEIIKIYVDIFTNDEDIDLFCKKCGSFGHEYYDEKCIFFNDEYTNALIKNEVKYCLNDIITKIIVLDEEEKKRIEKENKKKLLEEKKQQKIKNREKHELQMKLNEEKKREKIKNHELRMKLYEEKKNSLK